MSNEEQLLEKIIQKARRGGWEGNPKYYPNLSHTYFTLVFSHDFAKAFWGEEWVRWPGLMVKNLAYDPYGGNNEYGLYTLPAWQYHLQQMVLEEEPLKYLEQFLSTQDTEDGGENE